jgi:hypothetical protein
VVHLGTPQTLDGFYRKQSWHGVNVHRVFLRDILHSKSRKAMLFAVYMLVAIAAVIASACAGALSGSAEPPLAAAALLLIGPAALALRACMERKNWGQLPALTVLYGAYGLARALCLLGVGGSRKARSAGSNGPHTSPATELLG